MTTAPKILKTAHDLVGGNRQSQNGDKLPNHQNIAAIWTGILFAAGINPARPLNAHDVANMMEGMKIGRRYSGRFNLDDYVDGAGYAACAGEIAARLQE